MRRLFCLLLLSPIACSALTETTGIPASVSQVQTEIVNGQIVRIIQHNMELNPTVQFELLSRPNFEAIQTLTISEIPYDGEMLSLKDSSGAFVEDISIENNHVNILFDYYFLEGGSVLLECELPVTKESFDALQCHKQ
ncbi:hypothetical protein BTA51_24620 [Hahella sp. CCB-MM4]|uniref:hypothetical protein n=1 Tax=Hahella sp. (strain CCB-MM4) TaxID=1926491 RepID=UPI000B9C3B10|nr:hypothetical protein [Hahella sp. CCB-MM4]OZG70767.1 hypothetical protein BTA51_24620 [Hahella sp. CCB-MM4]